MTHFFHKKKLGQNFLNNGTVIEMILSVAHIMQDDVIVEIGPGEGVLTEAIALKAKKVIAVELDERLLPILTQRFDKQKNVHIVYGDILKMRFDDLATRCDFGGTSYKVVANIPYYITAPIIRYFLEQSQKPQSMTLMVQKEVAERLCAKPGHMSILAVAAQYYADVQYCFTVSRNDFHPVPEVDSAVVHFVIKNQCRDVSSDDLFRTVRIGFSARRKTLCNNLANGLHRSKKDIESILDVCSLSFDVRAQELNVDQWITITKMINKSM